MRPGSIGLIYQRRFILSRLLSSNDADTMSTELRGTYTQPRWWWRLSCRYLCRAARNPPSDDSQRHKSLVSHLSGTFPSPSSASLLLVRSFSLSLSLRSLPSHASHLSFLRFLPWPHVALPNQVLRALALIFPLPGFVSIVPRSWWCQPRAPKRA